MRLTYKASSRVAFAGFATGFLVERLRLVASGSFLRWSRRSAHQLKIESGRLDRFFLRLLDDLGIILGRKARQLNLECGFRRSGE